MLTLHIVRDRISLTKYSCCRYCLTQFKREAGENPARSRRCDGETFHRIHWTDSGKEWNVYEPESEDLPVCTAP